MDRAGVDVEKERGVVQLNAAQPAGYIGLLLRAGIVLGFATMALNYAFEIGHGRDFVAAMATFVWGCLSARYNNVFRSAVGEIILGTCSIFFGGLSVMFFVYQMEGGDWYTLGWTEVVACSLVLLWLKGRADYADGA